MELERLIPDVRPRDNWEASDLGVLMAREWYGALWLCFVAPMLLMTVLGLAFLSDSPTLLSLWVWWFKPLYERIPLHYLSRSIFAAAPALPALLQRPWQAMGTELLAALTYRRLSLRRSFAAPVYVLERLTGAGAAERNRTLSLQTEPFANWLTIIGVHIESALLMGLLFAAYLFLPDQVTSGFFEDVQYEAPWVDWIISVMSIAVFSFFGPFYVASGFALYLNRRVQLEAWDVEIAFRRLAERLAPREGTKPPRGGAVALILCISAAALLVTPAEALSSASSADPVQSREVIDEVLAEPDFHSQETRRYPKFLQGWLDSTLSPDEPESADVDGLLALMRGLATFFEALLWVSVVLLVVWLGAKLTGFTRVGLPAPARAPSAPASVFGIDLLQTPLPVDVPATARELWEAGDQRAALSLLLRAQLLRMVNDHGCHFRTGDTEQDCLDEVRRRAPVIDHRAFAALLNLWQRVAYAHRSPHWSEFDQVCRSLHALTAAPS